MSGRPKEKPVKFALAFKEVRLELIHSIQTDFGLLIKLQDHGVLTTWQVADIKVLHFLNFYRQ
jgi:hypothetical protein